MKVQGRQRREKREIMKGVDKTANKDNSNKHNSPPIEYGIVSRAAFIRVKYGMA